MYDSSHRSSFESPQRLVSGKTNNLYAQKCKYLQIVAFMQRFDLAAKDASLCTVLQVALAHEIRRRSVTGMNNSSANSRLAGLTELLYIHIYLCTYTQTHLCI